MILLIILFICNKSFGVNQNPNDSFNNFSSTNAMNSQKMSHDNNERDKHNPKVLQQINDDPHKKPTNQCEINFLVPYNPDLKPTKMFFTPSGAILEKIDSATRSIGTQTKNDITTEVTIEVTIETENIGQNLQRWLTTLLSCFLMSSDQDLNSTNP